MQIRKKMPCALALWLAMAPAPARAEETPPSPPPQTRAHWYGWQNLLVGGGSLGLFMAGATCRSCSKDTFAALVITGAGGYLLGGPTVHWAHGRLGTGFASLGINIAALPLMGLLVGGIFEVADTGGTSAFSDFDAGFFLVGPFLGSVAAVAVDSAVLARESVPVQAAPVASAPPVWRSLAPSLKARRGALHFGLSGAF